MGQPEPHHQLPGTGPAAGLIRCALAPGVRLRRAGARVLLVGDRPLTVFELSERGRRLLERLGAAEPAARPSPVEMRFLRRLADAGLVELRPVAPAWPAVSVVVPVRDRHDELAACLASLGRVRYPAGRLRVTVVDDGSRRAVTAPDGARLVRLAVPLGPAGARNAGAAGCRAELLAFLDSDCAAEPDWLERLVPELADPEVAAVGGRVLGSSERTWLERYESVRSRLDLGARRAPALPRTPVPYLVSANLVVRRAAFEAVGGFDPALRWGEDVDLSWRLHAAGHRLVYQPAGRARHRHRGGAAAFAVTRARYAASEAPLLRRHPGNGRWLGVSPGLAAALAGAAGAALGRPRLLAAGLAALVLETAAGAARLHDAGLPWRLAAPALLRGQATAAYHLARQLTGYYAAPAALLALAGGPARRRLLAGLAAAAAAPAVADWWRLRPRLSLPAFVAAHLLDEAAYNAGTLLGCLRGRTAAPLRVGLRASSPLRAESGAGTGGRAAGARSRSPGETIATGGR